MHEGMVCMMINSQLSCTIDEYIQGQIQKQKRGGVIVMVVLCPDPTREERVW